MKLKNLLHRAIGASLLPLVVSCGGVTPDAKIASALQTLMSNSLEAFLTKNATDTTVTFSCGGGGTMVYTVTQVTDPVQLIIYLRDTGAITGIDVAFNNCVIAACGDTLTLNGAAGSAKLGMSVGTLLGSTVTSGSDAATAFTLTSTSVTATGVLSGTLTFGYKLEAVYSLSPAILKQLTVKDADTPNPLNANGTTFDSATIATKADGC